MAAYRNSSDNMRGSKCNLYNGLWWWMGLLFSLIFARFF
jgi:hypothetical protein